MVRFFPLPPSLPSKVIDVFAAYVFRDTWHFSLPFAEWTSLPFSAETYPSFFLMSWFLTELVKVNVLKPLFFSPFILFVLISPFKR